jgi:hypothetical protein
MVLISAGYKPTECSLSSMQAGCLSMVLIVLVHTELTPKYKMVGNQTPQNRSNVKLKELTLTSLNFKLIDTHKLKVPL